jgi:high-affinity nickel-transport protein
MTDEYKDDDDAIDNVTRKLMQAGQRPVAVGFFFAAGHSALIILAAALFVGTATLFERFRAFSSIGGLLCLPHFRAP